jgi:hypothetical protein
MNTNTETSQLSLVSRGRELLERGDVSSAVAFYGKVFDPESTDETEARIMLIEGRSNLSRKFLPEALDCFEEALLMGSEIQRRQALDGISSIGQIRAHQGVLTHLLKNGFRRLLGKQSETVIGLALISDDENIVLISKEACGNLPPHMAKGARISRIPARLTEALLPIDAERCIPYTSEDDVNYILEIAVSLSEFLQSATSSMYAQPNT